MTVCTMCLWPPVKLTQEHSVWPGWSPQSARGSWGATKHSLPSLSRIQVCRSRHGSSPDESVARVDTAPPQTRVWRESTRLLPGRERGASRHGSSPDESVVRVDTAPPRTRRRMALSHTPLPPTPHAYTHSQVRITSWDCSKSVLGWLYHILHSPQLHIHTHILRWE